MMIRDFMKRILSQIFNRRIIFTAVTPCFIYRRRYSFYVESTLLVREMERVDLCAREHLHVCVRVLIFLFWLIKNAPLKLDEFSSRARKSRVLKTPTSSTRCLLNLDYPPPTISFHIGVLPFLNHI